MSAAEALSALGPLAAAVPGFLPRPGQQAMAGAIEEVLASRAELLCEAGTGTGKTYAYLVPALLSGLKVVVSTGTRALQDQLIARDLPTVARALGLSPRAAVLKGRGNYLCLHRLELTRSQQRLDPGEALMDRVLAWSARTRVGDIAELTDIPEHSALWPAVTSTRENCLGQSCPQYEHCFVVRARREAAAADLLIVNHHLFLADMVLRGEGFAELLPGADAFVLDEAHQLPDLAGEFLGVGVSSRQLLELARDTLREAGGAAAGLAPRTAALEQAVAVVRAGLGPEGRRSAWARLRDPAAVQAALQGLDGVLEQLQTALGELAAGSEALEQCVQRAGVLRARLQPFLQAPPARHEGEGEEQDTGDAVLWSETRGRGFGLHRTPIEIAQPFRARMQAYAAAWVFVSATLAVGDDFGHFARRLGLDPARARRWDSPFDYARQALVYLPEMRREPNAPGYTAEVVEVVRAVTTASRGRAFVLFTSHRALAEAEALLGREFDWPLLVQGAAPQRELLERFRALGNAVLLGTASFWEGVDVRGEALSCVVIDKLPFAPPDDPVVEARSEALREAGGNPFRDFHLPEAVLALKQGMGRLIRDEADRGVLVLCDPRLLSRGYGRTFLASLPAMPRTRALEDVRAFFAPA